MDTLIHSSPIPAPLRDTIHDTHDTTSSEENLNVTLMCPDCAVIPPHIIEVYADGDLVCGDCGLVLSDRIINTGQEWRHFANPSRVGEPDLQTVVARRLQRSAKARDVALTEAYGRVSTVCEKIGIPPAISDMIKEMYKASRADKRFQNKPEKSIVAGAILIACRQANVPRTITEVSDALGISRRVIGRILGLMTRVFKGTEVLPVQTSVKPASLIPRFCSNLGLPFKVESLAQDINTKSETIGALDGKSPVTRAAAAVLLASRLYSYTFTCEDIGQKTRVSDHIVRDAFWCLVRIKEDVICSKLVQQGSISYERCTLVAKKKKKRKSKVVKGEETDGDTTEVEECPQMKVI